MENFEDIEILRFLEAGYKVKMVKLSGKSMAVDVPEDIKKVEAILKKMKNLIKVFQSFTFSEKKEAYTNIFLMFVVSIMEAFSIGLILPISQLIFMIILFSQNIFCLMKKVKIYYFSFYYLYL